MIQVIIWLAISRLVGVHFGPWSLRSLVTSVLKPNWTSNSGYDSRLRGLRFSPFFQHGSTPKPYNNIMLPYDSGADESNSCNSSANFPPIQTMQLCLTSIWHCSVNYSVNNKSCYQFRFLIGEVSILVFRFWRNIDTSGVSVYRNTEPISDIFKYRHRYRRRLVLLRIPNPQPNPRILPSPSESESANLLRP